MDRVSVGDGGLQLAKKVGSLGSASTTTSFSSGEYSSSVVAEASGFATDNAIYMMGGTNQTGGVNYERAYVMKAALDGSGNVGTWTQIGTMFNGAAPPVGDAGIARWADRVYVGGGHYGHPNGDGPASVLYSVNLDSSGNLGSWRAETTLPFGGETKLFAVKGRLYAMLYSMGTLYSAPLAADGSVGAWVTESSAGFPVGEQKSRL